GELIALAKAKPGAINVASAGNGSFTHLAGELFRSMTGVTWTHVPYKGAPPAIGDLAGGRVDVMFSTMPAAMGSIKGGLVRAIAVSSPARVATLPDVPTVIESGVTGYEPAYWYGVCEGMVGGRAASSADYADQRFQAARSLRGVQAGARVATGQG